MRPIIVYTLEVIVAVYLILNVTIPAEGFGSLGGALTAIWYVIGYGLLLYATKIAFEKRGWMAVQIIIAFGVVMALFLTLHHYQLQSDNPFIHCSISDSVDCDIVLSSPYSVLFGIPIALWGLGYYLSMFVLVRIKKYPTITALFATFGVLFTGYLGFVSKVLIGVWCPLCMLTYMVNIAMFIFLFPTIKKMWKSWVKH